MTQVWYHGNCWDGIVAAWVASKHLPLDTLYIPLNYGDPMPNSSPDDTIYILDFSFPRAIMIMLHGIVKELIVIDHHKTAEEACHGLPFCHFDNQFSGASLTWAYFNVDKPAPLLVLYVEDRDLWKFKLTNSKEVNAFIQSFPMDIKVYDRISERIEFDVLGCAEMGEAIEQYKTTMVDRLCKESRFLVVGDTKFQLSIHHCSCRK
jgi:oligoribonuclease NrnB/cAMP/cGMP phosphodiesterase (DHH superfamily)